MGFLDDVSSRAKAMPGNLILPEAEDERTLRAAVAIEERSIAKVTLVGDPDSVAAMAKAAGIRLACKVVNPATAPHLDQFAARYYEMRKAKGMSEDEARATMMKPIPHGIMMLDQGMGDGLVAGACHSTADTLRPALQILRTAPGI